MKGLKIPGLSWYSFGNTLLLCRQLQSLAGVHQRHDQKVWKLAINIWTAFFPAATAAYWVVALNNVLTIVNVGGNVELYWRENKGQSKKNPELEDL